MFRCARWLLALLLVAGLSPRTLPGGGPSYLEIGPEGAVRLRQVHIETQSPSAPEPMRQPTGFAFAEVREQAWLDTVQQMWEAQQAPTAPQAYLNLWNATGDWVIRNALIDFVRRAAQRGATVEETIAGVAAAGLLAQESFPLTPPSEPVEEVETYEAYITVSRLPMSDAPLALAELLESMRPFPVEPFLERKGGVWPGPFAAPRLRPLPGPGPILFNPEGHFHHSLPGAVTHQAADDQCVPMSIADSLAFLESRHKINIPHDHKAGIEGDDSLVGQLGQAMGRMSTSRTQGDGVSVRQMVDGKFEYLAANNLSDELVHRHQGVGWGSAAERLPAGDYTAHGSTTTTDGMAVTWEWMCERVIEGCDVEVVYANGTDASGAPNRGHAVRVVGCGRDSAGPFIEYIDDRTQADDATGLGPPRKAHVEDSDNNGLVEFGFEGNIYFAMAEKPAPASGSTPPPAPPPTTRGAYLVNPGDFTVRTRHPPGAIASLFGRGLAKPSSEGPPQQAVLQDAPTELNDVEAWVGGRRAPLFFAGEQQINFQIPVETDPGLMTVGVWVDGEPADVISFIAGGAASSIFTLDPAIAGAGRGAVQNQDFSLNLPDSPAALGSVVIVYFTGGGALDPPVPTGTPAAADPLSELAGPVTATIGETAVTPAFAGATPGFIGLNQANVPIPGDLAAGDYELTLTVDGTASNAVLVSVGP